VTPIGAHQTSDGHISYLAAGPAEARAIVFLHGIGGGAELFTPQLAAFGARHRAISWNMPGYGASAPIEDASITGYAAALARFVADLGLVHPVLVGHSIGGMVVQRYLADGLGPVGAAVLAQTTAAFGGRDPRWAQDFVAQRLGALDRGETMRSLAPDIVAGLVGDDPDPEGVRLAERCVAAAPEAAYRASVHALVGFDLREAMARIAGADLVAGRIEGRERAGRHHAQDEPDHSGRVLHLPGRGRPPRQRRTPGRVQRRHHPVPRMTATTPQGAWPSRLLHGLRTLVRILRTFWASFSYETGWLSLPLVGRGRGGGAGASDARRARTPTRPSTAFGPPSPQGGGQKASAARLPG
jgi:3-oxoadipate enol-lactonase